MYDIILTELGIVVMKDDSCVKQFPFTRRAQEYLDCKSGKASLAALVTFLAAENAEVETNDNGVMSILKRSSIDTAMMSQPKIDAIQDSKPSLLTTTGFASSDQDALGKLRDFALELSSSKVAQVSEMPDLHIIQAINTLDDIDKVANALFGRLREWYGLHFPELENLVDSMAGYCKVALVGRRDALNQTVFVDLGFPDSKADMLNLVARTSRGGQISDENLRIVQSLAQQVLDLYDSRGTLEEHVELQMKMSAPNLSAIAGTGVGARLLAKAGSLKRLATMAASTIQVLGAEKALFRSIKTGSQPPKHGIIFQHAMVHRAPRWQRGKMARAVASKTAIASRMDAHEPKLNATLLEKLNIRVDEISEKYSEPPPVPSHERVRSNNQQIARRKSKLSSGKARRSAKKPKRKRRFAR